MNLCKQNSKWPHVNEKHQTCPSNTCSPEMASRAFLKWIPIQELDSQRSHDCGRAVSVVWWATNIHAWSQTRKLWIWIRWPLFQSTQHPNIYITSLSLFPWKTVSTWEEKTQKKQGEKQEQSWSAAGSEEWDSRAASMGRRQKASTAASGYTKSSL